MCRFLKISKSTYYFILNNKSKVNKNIDVEEAIISAFNNSKSIYGARKLKNQVKDKFHISRSKVRKIMKKHNLVSKYTKLTYKNHSSKGNNELIENIVDRKFDNRAINEVIVSDLTYVKVGNKWHYICLLIDLFNREIIGHSVGKNKNALLVKQAFINSSRPIINMQIFHTDRGNEFKNKIINEILLAFNIKRSLSKKGCPYDNAVAEATYKIFKTEFINDEKFSTLDELKYKLFDYINWYNNFRIHSTLGYLTPVNYRKTESIKK